MTYELLPATMMLRIIKSLLLQCGGAAKVSVDNRLDDWDLNIGEDSSPSEWELFLSQEGPAGHA